MTKATVGNQTKWVVLIFAALMLVRGVLILFARENAIEWSNLLGIGGLEAADAQFGFLAPILRIIQIIEGRLWIIVAFPLFFGLAWGRDVTIMLAMVGAVIQVFRLFAGNGIFALIWLAIYIGIAIVFYASPAIKAYLVAPPKNEVKSH
jgi:hypothetical protein